MMWPLERKQQYILLAVAALVLLAAGYKYALLQQADDLIPARGLVAESSVGMPAVGGSGPGVLNENNQGPAELVVHVAGAVQKTGVYHLPAGARVVDAVEMAGAAADAALDYLNLAALLQDEQQVYVYSLDQINQPGHAGAPTPHQMSGPAPGGINNAGLININTAGQGELEQLPGIGPALAQRIIDHRSQHGSFGAIEDITQVSGIGNKRFEQMKSKICVH